jgi:hypothetical protein
MLFCQDPTHVIAWRKRAERTTPTRYCKTCRNLARADYDHRVATETAGSVRARAKIYKGIDKRWGLSPEEQRAVREGTYDGTP